MRTEFSRQKLLSFFILDCASIEPASISFDGEVLCSMDNRTRINMHLDDWRPSETIVHLRDKSLIILDSPFDFDTPRDECEYRLTAKGGSLWSKLALPSWRRYTAISHALGSQFTLHSMDEEQLLRTSHDIVRYSTMSARIADSFTKNCLEKITIETSAIVYWANATQLFRLDIVESDLQLGCEDLDSLETHKAWFTSMILSQRWREFGFSERYCEFSIVDKSGHVRQNELHLWLNRIEELPIHLF